MNSFPIVRIGVIGTASIANRSMIPAILSLSKLYKLAGIASRDSSKAEICAKKFESIAYHCYESLIKDSNIDAVYIPLPNALHYKYVMMALDHGKHVFVEKSLGCSVTEVEQMVLKAKRNKIVLLENFHFRFHLQLVSILKLLKEGAIGDLRCVRVAFGFPPFKDQDNIRYSAELGGGALLDAGAYAVKIAPYFLGNDLFVSQGSIAMDANRNVDIWGGGVLQQCNGPLFCQFSYGFDHYYQCSLELWGSIGKLSTNRIFTAPRDLKTKLLLESNGCVQEIMIQADDAFSNILKYFYNLINGNEDAEIEYSQNIEQAKLIGSFKSYAQIKC
jgi:NDP-hexose-3-ketoreductase